MVQLVDLTLVAWALSSAPGAAPGPRQAKPVRPTPSSSAVRRFEFTPALKLLPPNYSGDSIADYFRVVPKDQFETTAQYQERLAASPAPKAIAAFRLANVSPDYNADDRVLTITVEKRPKVIIPDGTPSGEQKNFAPSPTLLIKQDTITDRQYDATNAFGARFSVHETTYVDYSVLVDGVSGPSLEEIAKSGDP